MHWSKQAVCVNADPELFFPGEHANQNWANQAKRWCNACPVRWECLTAAMAEEVGEPADFRHGVRGGLNGTERFQLANRMEVA